MTPRISVLAFGSIRRNVVRGLLTCIVLASTVLTAGAETVRIDAVRSTGHGWLFGATVGSDVRCFLASPRHVLLDENKQLQPFQFLSRSGQRGESAVPVAVDQISGLSDLTGTNDLAFAAVLSGPIDGCLSRLGLPSFALDTLVNTNPKLTLYAMNTASFATLEARLSGGSIANSAFVGISPTHASSEDYFSPGLSGATVSVTREIGPAPFAMILKIDPHTRRALGLRFDRIGQAFQRVRPLLNASQPNTLSNGLRYEIIGIEAITRDGGRPSAMHKVENCWSALPAGGRKDTRFIIRVPTTTRINEVRLAHGDTATHTTCGTMMPFDVDQRLVGTKEWNSHVSCTTIADATEAGCRLGLRGPRELRFRISGAVGLQQLSVR